MKFFIILILTISVWSQDFKFGLTGSAVLSQFAGDDVEKSALSFSFNAGFVLEKPLNETIAIQGSLLFQNNKVNEVHLKEHDDHAGHDDHMNFNINSIVVPINILYKLNQQFSFIGGFHAHYIFLAESEEEGEDHSHGYEEIKSEDRNSFNYGIQAGLAYNFDKINIQTSYFLGLSKPFKEEEGDAHFQLNYIELKLIYFLGN